MTTNEAIEIADAAEAPVSGWPDLRPSRTRVASDGTPQACIGRLYAWCVQYCHDGAATIMAGSESRAMTVARRRFKRVWDVSPASVSDAEFDYLRGAFYD